MNIASNIRIIFVCVLIAFASIIKSEGRRQSAGFSSATDEIFFSATQKTSAGTIRVEIAERRLEQPFALMDSVCTVRIGLNSLQGVTGKRQSKYPDRDFLKCFYAVAGADTIRPLACEQIPGIGKGDFLYISLFNSKILNSYKRLRICITDSVDGFGPNSVTVRN